MPSDKKTVVTYAALQAALNRANTKLGKQADINGLGRELINMGNQLKAQIKDVKDDVTILKEVVAQHASLSITVNGPAGTATASVSGLSFSDLLLHNRVGATVTDSVSGSAGDVYGVVVSAGQDSVLMTFDLGDIAESPGLLLVRYSQDGALGCTLMQQKDTESGHSTWEGCRFKFVENSAEYTIEMQNRGGLDLDKVKVGDTVTFDVDWGSGIMMGALTGIVSTIAYELKYGNKDRAGCTVILDPWYGTDWKYRTLKMRYDGYNWTTYYYQ